MTALAARRTAAKPGALRRRATATARAVGWLLIALGGLAFATFLALLLGYARYVKSGRPNSWEQRQREMLALQTVRLAAPQQYPNGYALSRLGPGAVARGNPATEAFGWKWLAPGVFEHVTGPRLVYQPAPDNTILRSTIVMRPSSRDAARGFLTRLHAVWGPPNATAGEVGGTAALDAVTVWRSPSGIALVLVEIDGTGEWLMTVHLIGPHDPRHRARLLTGGLPSHHPLAEEVARQLREPPALGKKPKPPVLFSPRPQAKGAAPRSERAFGPE